MKMRIKMPSYKNEKGYFARSAISEIQDEQG